MVPFAMKYSHCYKDWGLQGAYGSLCTNKMIIFRNYIILKQKFSQSTFHGWWMVMFSITKNVERSNIHQSECGFQHYLRINIAIISMFTNFKCFSRWRLIKKISIHARLWGTFRRFLAVLEIILVPGAENNWKTTFPVFWKCLV